MASLKEEARDVLGDAKDGICWIAVWKTGRTWHAEPMYETVYEEGSRLFRTTSKWNISDDDAKRIREICEEDPEACLMNPIYKNMGPWEEMTLASLIDGIRFQYGFGGNAMGILEEAGKA